MAITQNEESIVPAELKPGGNYGDAYVGKGGDDIADLETGATVKYTEAAIKSAVSDALVYLNFAEEKPDIPRAEEELLTLAKDFYAANGGSADGLEVSVPEDTTFVKRIYREKGKQYCVAYAVSISQYGTPEFELLVYIGADGSVQDISKILWKVSDARPDWGYNPPTEDKVDEFFDSFVGKNEETVSSVDIENGTTNTSGKLRDAVAECFGYGGEPTVSYAARIIGIAVICSALIGFVAILIINRKRRAAK
jgi:hypothetical protein